ncbi:MAG: tRNA pseudouridine(38-40) synthase TruA [Clostridia bacterium]|nr:tRNA pseudouridine(38-40) synthase TruA [Clostridia bacterium]
MRYLITVEYFGKAFNGWQTQKEVISVQQTLEEVLSALLREKISITGSGRTDAGVHALAQKAHFDTNSTIPMNKIPLAVNTMLPEDIRITGIEEKAADFHAQYSAKRKTYLYKFYVSRTSSPIRRHTHAQILPPLDFKKMKDAAKILVGAHDFKAFCASGSLVKTTTRTLYRLELWQQGDEIFMEAEGNGFLYNMVRIIAGTLVYAGKSKLSEEDIRQALETGDRKKAGKTFPASGLYLKDVVYE